MTTQTTGAQWTAALRDPELPAVAALLTREVPRPLAELVEASGGTVAAHRLTNVTWWPGRSITVQWGVEVTGGDLAGHGEYIGTTLGAGADCVRVWRCPDDPSLPALATVLAPEEGRTTRVRAYRPGRRAVVEVQEPGGSRHFLKLVKPKKLEALLRRHRELARSLPVSEPTGSFPELGLLVLPDFSGTTLREALEDPDALLPDPALLVELPEQFPELTTMPEVTSSIAAAIRMAELLTALLPGHADQIAALLARLGTDDVTERVVAHGDYHEAQLVVADGAVTGLLDVDSFGWGRPGEDAAAMLAHLTLWSALSTQPERVRAYAGALQELWDDRLDPVDLRRRVAARLLGLAVGPFRSQAPDWPAQVAWRLGLAESWLEAAEWCAA